ncbi:MAG: RNase adapter RapZ [Bacteroidota bacterium]
MKEQLLSTLFESWAHESCQSIEALPQSGSCREYFRLSGPKQTAVGVYHTEFKENQAFLGFTRHFLEKGLPVPKIYGENLSQNVYLLEDLGDQTLFADLMKKRINGHFPDEVEKRYQQALEQLVRFQVEGGEGLDYSLCYPRDSFDQQSMMWDLNYFKYYFLKLTKVPFDEQALEDDFHRFSNFLLQAEHSFFLYRDFQARNIMLHNDQPYFIDYQGGRRGALQYDLASLLYQAKANLPGETREKLLGHYLDALSNITSVDRETFIQFYYGYVLMRTIQVLGAYGFRGFYERKSHFLESIPFAIRNLDEIMGKLNMPVKLPALMGAMEQIINNQSLTQLGQVDEKNQSLKVQITSFSYKKGVPVDESEHGGGFVFDCRSIHNPGRYDEYKRLTGRDESVKHFLQKEPDMTAFLTNVFALVDASVEKYLSRGFTHLCVNFGCTGGQHRSVYSADRLAEHLEKKYGVSIDLTHIEQERKGWVN